MNEKTNISTFGDDALEQEVYNDSFLYSIRFDRESLIFHLEFLYTFTLKQFELALEAVVDEEEAVV